MSGMLATTALLAGLFAYVLPFASPPAPHVLQAQSASPSRTVTKPAPALRLRFREMFARAYFPGRSGQIMVVPREGSIITRDDPALLYMHGSPWPYDVRIPMFFVGAQVKPGVYAAPAGHQDVGQTIAAALGTAMPAAARGRVLPVLRPGGKPPRAVALIVLDGMRTDYFDRHAKELPTLTRLRKQSAWMADARVDYLPTNTAVGHTTIVTGADPRVHGITGNNLFDHVNRRRRDSYPGWTPADLMALTVADVWQLENAGRPVIIALGPSVPAATALAGHGACQLNGVRTTLAGYDEGTGRWSTNPACFAPIDGLKELVASSLWPADGRWMGHQVDSPSGVRRSGLFPRFEADALIRLIESSDVGRDDVADLVLLNYKAADYVGHKHGPASAELRATLAEMDIHFARILSALEAKVGNDYLLAVTADHGMPGEPAAPAVRVTAPAVVDALHARFDPKDKKLITYYEPENAQIFVDTDRAAALSVTLRDLAAFLETQPYIFAAFTEEEIRRTSRSLR
jgi:Type I phosphodiesterase / nucleotide pyrophosphatase